MKKILPFLTVLLFVLSFGGTVLLSNAQEGEEAAAPESGSGSTEYDATMQGMDYYCGEKVNEVAKEQVSAYAEFLTAFFQEYDESSEQVTDAMEYFRYVQDEIDKVYEENRVKQGGGTTLETAFYEYNYCKKVHDDWMDLAQELLQAHSLQSSNSKRTFRMIDAMKSMNENMDALSNDFNRVFPGSFKKMDSQLQCFVPECITK
ncbi:hypothetical protein KKC94_02125 [Patescibacteria group bacterium]|nr:hypothetical protein [Patescibacteria group bacterium]